MPLAPPSIMPTAPNRAMMAAISSVVLSQLLNMSVTPSNTDWPLDAVSQGQIQSIHALTRDHPAAGRPGIGRYPLAARLLHLDQLQRPAAAGDDGW
jgi:hypothetical protein